MKKYQVMIVMKNVPGIMQRVLGLFSKRGYNIEGITAGVSEDKDFFRITTSVYGNKDEIEQVEKQVEKLVDVKKVIVFDDENTIKRELIFIKVQVSNENRAKIMDLVNIYRAKIIDVSTDTFIIELTGENSKVESFINLIDNFGILEISRTGVTAMHRGKEL